MENLIKDVKYKIYKICHRISMLFPRVIDVLRVRVIGVSELLSIKKGSKIIKYTDGERVDKSTKTMTPEVYGSNSSNEFVRSKAFEFPDEFVTSIKDVTLIGRFGFNITRRSETIKPVFCREDQPGANELLKEAIINNPYETFITLKGGIYGGQVNHIEHGFCLNTSKRPNYYTWVGIELLKLRAMEEYQSRNNISATLVIPDDGRTYVYESLKFLGYDEERWNLASRETAFVENLIVSTYPQPRPSNLQWLNERANNRLSGNNNGPTVDRVFLSRSKSGRRQVANEEQFVGELRRFGFRRFFPEDLSFPQQVSLISQASVLLAPHGASLCNMIWGTDLKVVEIFNDVATEPYNVMARNMGHEYYAFQGHSDKPCLGKHSDIHIPIKSFKNFLNKEVLDT